jgi:hypothetical protein
LGFCGFFRLAGTGYLPTAYQQVRKAPVSVRFPYRICGFDGMFFVDRNTGANSISCDLPRRAGWPLAFIPGDVSSSPGIPAIQISQSSETGNSVFHRLGERLMPQFAYTGWAGPGKKKVDS